MEFEDLLKLMVEKGGSDLFITAGVPPSMKIHGRIVPVTKTSLSPEQTRETVLAVMNEGQRKQFIETHECNFAISARGIGRFRVSAFYQRKRDLFRDGYIAARSGHSISTIWLPCARSRQPSSQTSSGSSRRP